MDAIELDGGTRNRIIIDCLVSEGQLRKDELLQIGSKAREDAKFGFRQQQIIPELVAHASSSFDLLAHGWERGELLYMGAAARSLYETRLFTVFVVNSEANAVRFYQDGVADIRDIFDSLGGMATNLQSADFEVFIDHLRKELAQFMTANDVDEDLRYLRTGKVAASIGLKEDHDLHYRFLSKFSHASSVTVLTRGGDNWKQLIAPLLSLTGVLQYFYLFASVNDAMSEGSLRSEKPST